MIEKERGRGLHHRMDDCASLQLCNFPCLRKFITWNFRLYRHSMCLTFVCYPWLKLCVNACEIDEKWLYLIIAQAPYIFHSRRMPLNQSFLMFGDICTMAKEERPRSTATEILEWYQKPHALCYFSPLFSSIQFFLRWTIPPLKLFLFWNKPTYFIPSNFAGHFNGTCSELFFFDFAD